MLDYKLLKYKPTITYNNETYTDLLARTFNENAMYTPIPVVVNEYYVARPDLISLTMFGTDQYADIICKINGISNPFEMNENDVLVVPNVEYLTQCLAKTRNASEMINDPDNEVIQKLDKSNKQKRKNELRSPNEQLIGNSNYVIDKSLGLVFY